MVCDVRNNAVSCTARDLNTVPDKIIANVDPEGILKLDLSNNLIETLPEGSFRAYSKLEEIVIANSELVTIDNGAFNGLEQLLTLNVSHNNLTELKSDIFTSNANLQFLILSDNQLESWDNFKVSDFVNLQYLDISDNRFTYLPTDILTTLEVHPTFTIVLDGNPWDCNNEALNQSIVAKYICGTPEESGVWKGAEVNVSTTAEESSATDIIGAFNPTTESSAANICVVKSTRRNLLLIWLALAIIAGILIGNADRIYSWLHFKCSKTYITTNTSKYIFSHVCLRLT